MATLTTEQKNDIQFLLSFYDINKNRATGRSFSQAIAFIELAILNPGTYIHVIDHAIPMLGDREHIKNNMMYLIQDILENDYPEDISERFSFSKLRIKYS